MFKLVKRSPNKKGFSHELYYNGKLYRKSVFYHTMDSHHCYFSEIGYEDKTEYDKNIPFKEILSLKGTDLANNYCLDKQDAEWEKRKLLPLYSILRKGNTVFFQYCFFTDDIKPPLNYVQNDMLPAYFRKKAKKFKNIKVYSLSQDSLFIFEYTIAASKKISEGYMVSRKQMDLFFNPALDAVIKLEKNIKKSLKLLK